LALFLMHRPLGTAKRKLHSATPHANASTWEEGNFHTTVHGMDLCASDIPVACCGQLSQPKKKRNITSHWLTIVLILLFPLYGWRNVPNFGYDGLCMVLGAKFLISPTIFMTLWSWWFLCT
jgi:hypothetical protein